MKGIKKIKNYRLIREIGKGAVGIVYEAVDDVNNKKFAVKSMATDKLKGNQEYEKNMINSFKQELKILRNLDHHNIIKIFGVEKTNNNIYLILEYANGGNLYEYLNFYKKNYKAPLTEQIVQFLVRQISKGIEYMHKNNVTHRDIKLENILLHFPQVQGAVDYQSVKIEEAIVKIADLGYAKELQGDDVMKTICGTPMSMAPDIIKNYGNYKSGSEKTYNSKVDLWSLGTITYELLFGVPPFFARTIEELFSQIMEGKYNMPQNSKVSIEAITFLNGLLQFNADLRIDWDEIKIHPFLVNKVRDFHLVDIEQVIPDKNNKKPQLDSKDPNNFLWVLLKPKDNVVKDIVKLDKVDKSIFLNPKVLNEISHKPNDIPKDSGLGNDQKKVELEVVNEDKRTNSKEVKIDKKSIGSK